MSATKRLEPDPGPTCPAPARSLREALQASGAQPNSRMSALSRYMLDHYNELHALKVVEGYSWQAIAAVLARQAEFAGTPGQPVTAAAAKLAWSRIGRRKRQATAVMATSAPGQEPVATPGHPESHPGPGSAPEPPTAALPAAIPAFLTSQVCDKPSAPVDLVLPDIRPARPRGAPFAPAPAQTAARSTPSLLSEDEVTRRLDELAARQGRPVIPPPEVL